MRMRTLMTTAALAAVTVVPVLTATGSADAATVGAWQRIANCESGGRWHIDTGNGYYGGLQISASTWNAYGGRRFASRPDRASRRQQVRIAQRIRRGQGWGAWPVCSVRAGVR